MFRYLFLILSCSFLSKAQTNAIDTSFYENGSVKSILFESDYFITGYLCEVFYAETNCANLPCIGRRVADSIYLHFPYMHLPRSINELNKGDFNFSRKYYYDGVVQVKDKKLNGYYSYESLILNNQLLTIVRKRKFTSYTEMYLVYDDTLKFTTRKTFAYIKFNDGRFPLNQLFHVDTMYLEINAFEDGTIKQVIFKDEKSLAYHGKFIEFYSNECMRTLGYYDHGFKTGMWQEWYDNDQPKSTGSYGKTITQNGSTIEVKDKEWKYFDETGKLLKSEFWDKGVL